MQTSQCQDISRVASESPSDVEEEEKMADILVSGYPRDRISHGWHPSRPQMSKKMEEVGRVLTSNLMSTKILKGVREEPKLLSDGIQ